MMGSFGELTRIIGIVDFNIVIWNIIGHKDSVSTCIALIPLMIIQNGEIIRISVAIPAWEPFTTWACRWSVERSKVAAACICVTTTTTWRRGRSAARRRRSIARRRRTLANNKGKSNKQEKEFHVNGGKKKNTPIKERCHITRMTQAIKSNKSTS
jgi:hypothetical protein